jgi:trans-aconitate 2-methyltransferase
MAVEFDGKRYEQTSVHQKEWGARLIDELGFRGDERILDVGCGDGALTAKLAQAVPDGSVVGIDASAGMIQAAYSHGNANLSFQQLDVTAARFVGEFDIIFSNATLHWVKNHDKLLSVLHRALRSSGVLRVNFAADGNCSTFNRTAKQLMVRSDFRDVFVGFDWPWYMPTVEAYAELVRQSPFSESQVWGENADRYFPDTKTMLGWIDHPAIVPFKQQLDSRIAQRFHKAMADLMVAATKQSDSTCFETFRRLNVMARK